MSDIAIRTDGLTKRYGRNVAVDGLSIDVTRGHVYGLLGPNGSGKTTTIGMLLGLLRPTSGTFSLLGSAERHRGRPASSRRRRGDALLLPLPLGAAEPHLLPGDLGPGLSRRTSTRCSTGSGSCPVRTSRFHTYSLGMKQRLGIAYALLGDPELLFLDEPTNGMDPEGMAEIRELIRSLGTGGRTVLLSSHLLNEVEQVCDSVTILSKGKLVAQGRVAELLGGRGREQMRMRTTDDAAAHGILAALDWVDEVRPADGALMVSAPHERSWELTAALGRGGVYVSELAPVQTSLEAYFLEVTGEGEAESE